MPKKVAFTLILAALLCVNCEADLVPESLRQSKAEFDLMVEEINRLDTNPVSDLDSNVLVVVISTEVPTVEAPADAQKALASTETMSATEELTATAQLSPTESLTWTEGGTAIAEVNVAHAPAVVRVISVQEIDPSKVPTPTPPQVVVEAQSSTMGPADRSTPEAANALDETTVQENTNDGISDVITDVAILTETTAITITTVMTTSAPAGPPMGMTGVEDRIWVNDLESMIANAFQQDGVERLNVEVNGTEVSAAAQVQIIPLITDRVEAHGHLSVEDESLVILVDQVLLSGDDVTGIYKAILEQRLESALYRLLPERFVQDFAVDEQALTVQSWMRRR